MSIKGFLIGCLLPMFFAGSANANDSSSSGIGGRWQMLKAEHRQVQMVREHVRIVPSGKDGFGTTADFVFRNRGPATTVEMGFPESGYGDTTEHLSLLQFKSWVDGRRVPVRRRVVSQQGWSALWVKTVHFARNQTRRVRVRFVGGNGGGNSSGGGWVSYNFTGGNWRGEVEESVLDVELPRGTYLLPMWGDEKQWISKSQRHGNHFRFRWTHWQAQKDFQLSYQPTFPNDLLRHQFSASCSLGSRPDYETASAYKMDDGIDVFATSQLLPVVRGNGMPNCILLDGHLWVSAKAFSRSWDLKRRGVVLKHEGKEAFFSAVDATKRSSLWPLAPNETFWIDDGSPTRVLMIPARDVSQKLGGYFGLDFARGRAIWVKGNRRHIFRANPNS